MKVQRLAVLLALVWSAQAQDIRGMISGTVTDPQGAHVVGAAVTVTNTGTNVSTPLTTNSNGYYEAPLLAPGPYQVSVDAAGFKKTVRSNLILTMRAQLRIDIQLEVGAVNESITISAESPILDTSTVSMGKALTTREIMDLPIMTNNLVLMARLAPGVVNQGTTQFLTQGMVGGGSGFYSPLYLGQNEWSIDGAPNLGSGGIAFMPFTDQIAEFKIDTTSFDASVGHSIGLNIAFSDEVRHQQPPRLGDRAILEHALECGVVFRQAEIFPEHRRRQRRGQHRAGKPTGVAADAGRRAFERLRVYPRRARLHPESHQRQEQALLVLFPTRRTRLASRPAPVKSPIPCPPWRSGRATSRTSWQSMRNTRSTIR